LAAAVTDTAGDNQVVGSIRVVDSPAVGEDTVDMAYPGESTQVVGDSRNKDSLEEEGIVEEDTDSFVEDTLELEVDRTHLVTE
jgi:hypothetical protein